MPRKNRSAPAPKEYNPGHGWTEQRTPLATPRPTQQEATPATEVQRCGWYGYRCPEPPVTDLCAKHRAEVFALKRHR